MPGCLKPLRSSILICFGVAMPSAFLLDSLSSTIDALPQHMPVGSMPQASSALACPSVASSDSHANVGS